VKSTGIGGEQRSYDPGKKVKGRKASSTRGHAGAGALKAKVHAASVFDRDGIKPLMELVVLRGSPAFLTWGLMAATTARVRAKIGPRRRWD